jgi:N-glycosylase/DNA lyase
MTPKLYDIVQSKLECVWGPWAGWAHTVLFTADLKAFENYGLPTPPVSPEKPRPSMKRALTTPLKRKREADKVEDGVSTVETDTIQDVLVSQPMETDSMLDRVKRTRRTPRRSNTYT